MLASAGPLCGLSFLKRLNRFPQMAQRVRDVRREMDICRFPAGWNAHSVDCDATMSDMAANWAFDIYSDNIREASVFFMKTGASTDDWSIELFPFERTILQFGSDGGPRIVHGVVRSDAAIFMLQIVKTAREVFFDGQALRWHDMAILAPGAHFTFASQAPARWIALSVPVGLLNDAFAGSESGWEFLCRNTAVSLSQKAASKFASVATTARLAVKEGADLRLIERRLLDSLLFVLADKETTELRVDSQLVAVEGKMKVALEYVRSRPEESISVSDLVDRVGVSPRALYRCFQRYLKIAPKDYLKYRQLNLVRRALRLDTIAIGQKNPVTMIFSNYGVSEFGRFALEYKRLFKELPSQTVARRSGVRSQAV
jgi:AraC family transcriptional regulator, ethanolamine operon transcriptional activator